jgi:hypothetical protein
MKEGNEIIYVKGGANDILGISSKMLMKSSGDLK